MARTPFEQNRTTRIKACMVWLSVALVAGPQPASQLIAEARARGFSSGTLQHARERLRVESKREKDGWVWLPPKRPSAIK